MSNCRDKIIVDKQIFIKYNKVTVADHICFKWDYVKGYSTTFVV